MREPGPHWYGLLTIENIDAVTKAIEAMFLGKHYCFVAVNECMGMRPDVRTGQRIAPEKARDRRGISVYHPGDLVGFAPGSGHKHARAGFNVIDTYGVWGLSTGAHDGDARNDYEHPYLVFGYDKLTIEHRAPAGHRLVWALAIEHERELVEATVTAERT